VIDGRVGATRRARRARRIAAVCVFTATLAAAGERETAPLSRGEYLARHVAMCVQCHTPRQKDGALDETQLFRGAPIPLTSPYADQLWATTAPSLAGLPGFSDEDAIFLLTTGRRRSGEVPRPPMPPFRLSRDDAAAVVAYLRSLSTAATH
jgi:mono/diheme cytochrome c family protein